MTRENVTPFIKDQFTDNDTVSRVVNACPQLFEDYDFPADGDWEYTGRVLIIAQSASKLYDGNPLTRTSDILVYNLPELFDITASAVVNCPSAGRVRLPFLKFLRNVKAHSLPEIRRARKGLARKRAEMV